MKIVNVLSFLFIVCMLASCGNYKDLGAEARWDYNNFRNQQKVFSGTDSNLAYTDKGEGDVIVLLHGVPSSSWLYRKMIDDLANKGYRVIAPDMLGFGNSDSPDGYELYSSSNHAKRLLALMESLNINSWTHVVHDAGGPWTWALIEQDKTKIENLIILNTVLYDEGFRPPIRLKKGFFARLAMSLYRSDLTGKFMLHRFMKKALKDQNSLSQQEFEGYIQPLKEGKTQGMYYFFTNIRKPFPEYDEFLRTIQVPKLVVWGAADQMLLLAPQKERIINELKVAPENIYSIQAKHFLQEESPGRIVKLITNFLEK